jgi:hypothetical protein
LVVILYEETLNDHQFFLFPVLGRRGRTAELVSIFDAKICLNGCIVDSQHFFVPLLHNTVHSVQPQPIILAILHHFLSSLLLLAHPSNIRVVLQHLPMLYRLLFHLLTLPAVVLVYDEIGR